MDRSWFATGSPKRPRYAAFRGQGADYAETGNGEIEDRKGPIGEIFVMIRVRNVPSPIPDVGGCLPSGSPPRNLRISRAV
jgi:hypothetical protein